MFCKWFLFVVWVCWSPGLAAQYYRSPGQSPYLLSAAGFPAAPNPLSVSSTPALLPGTPAFMAGIYAENLYGIAGLNTLQAAFTIGRPRQGGGMQVSYLGMSVYHELSFGLHYGKSLGKLNLGMGFRYYHFSARGLNGNSALAYTISSSWKLSENISGAISLTNPFVPGIKPEASIAPQYALSFGFSISDQVFVESRIIKEEARNLQSSVGLRYRPDKKLNIYIGCWPFYFRPFLSLGWNKWGMCVQVAVSYHPSLGASPGLLMIYDSQPQSSDQ
jgi:hypothetical protein